MKTLHFICTFESDIVLHGSSNMEGNIERLDYIPGSNFLGMAARKYSDFGADAFDVFHSGAVRFGDAHVLIEKELSYPIPFSWFAPKGINTEEALLSTENNKRLCNDHFMTSPEYDSLIMNGIQLKQQRNGFVNPHGKVETLEHLYSQKSAHDKDKRRSKEGQMFGYYALASGTQWHFSVEIDEGISDAHCKRIEDILVKSRRLGKSRSAEYGHIKIELDTSTRESTVDANNTIEIKTKHYIFLYANSRLALTDATGINSYYPDLDALHIEQEYVSIDWSKSQIRTSRYTPYVGARQNFDPERLVIDKGSIIALSVPDTFDVLAYKSRLNRGIGLYLSEGHGKVLVNPVFLTSKYPTFNHMSELESESKKSYPSTVNIWLTKEKEREISDYELLKEVNTFIGNHPKEVKNKKSQWGQIRSLCNASKTNEDIYLKLFDNAEANGHKKGFLLHGKAMSKWSSTLIDTLKNIYDETKKEQTDYLQFIKLLSIYAPKQDDKKEDSHE